MRTRGTQRRWIVPAYVLAVALLSALVWQIGYRQALDPLAERAAADLDLASDRLTTQLQVYQELAVLTAGHPALAEMDSPGRRAAARALLLGIADKTAALDVIYADSTGRVRAAAKAAPDTNLAGRPHFRRAMQGALGASHGADPVAGRRVYSYAAPAFDPTGAVRGALIVVADVEDIEEAWRGSTPAVYFTDRTGVVFVSNRSELLGWRRPGQGAGLAPADGGAVYFDQRRAGRHDIWHLGWGPYLPPRALHLSRDLPVIGLMGEVLVDVAPARRLAALQAAAVAAICLAFGALLYLATVRRRTLAEANVVLETRVAARTRALSAANDQLRREVAERQEAEAALKRAQADLVQAGKLSALGQMSAGISHELNQPLMAIRSCAENGAENLNQGRPQVAGENLARISDLARRMGRIIRNLRAFARQESVAATRVDLVAVLDGAIDMTGPRLKQDGIALDFDRPAGPVWVRGGQVRLEQVFLNLITNAADAMDASPDKRLTLCVSPGPSPEVTVRDTGPGLVAPDKVFEPFFTTKEVGASEGMGLGLSISYGIVQSFGGEISGGNAPGGGAEFTVRLEQWREEKAA